MRTATMIAAVGLSLSLVTFSAIAQPGRGFGAGQNGPIGPGAGAAGFEDGPRGPKGPGMRGGPRADGDLFERFDLNEDGVISQEEVEQLKAQRQARVEERAQRMAQGAIERFDANEDGTLDQDELAQMFAQRPRMGGPGHPGGHDGAPGRGGPAGKAMRLLGPETIAQFDTDGDGNVSREEAKAQKDQIKAALEAKKGEIEARFDLDGDGQLSPDERQTLRTTLSAERRVQRADLNHDGSLDAQELRAALELIDDQDPRADFNADGEVNQEDYEALVKAMPGA
ncbi:MAG: hypothetical protein Tsb0013_08430 [Phycisphaerales bacterium]